MEESETKSEDQISESELVPAIQLVVELWMASTDRFLQDKLNRTEECFVGVWSTVKVKKGGGNTYVCKRKC